MTAFRFADPSSESLREVPGQVSRGAPDDAPASLPVLPRGPLLRLRRGRVEPAELRLAQQRVVLGRGAGCDLRLEDDAASRAHAEIVFEGDGFVVRDLGSANGLFVDGQRVATASLHAGSVLRLGATELELVEMPVGVSAAARLALLDRCELLASADAAAKRALTEAMAVRVFPRGAVISRQGEALDGLYFVESGVVRLVEVNDEGGERLLANLGAGGVYGERSLLPGQSERCTLVAETEACLLELPRARLDELLARKPDVERTVRNLVRDRLATGVGARPEPAARPDSLATQEALEVEIVGADRKLLAVREKVTGLARSSRSLLLAGAAGTGKRTFARLFHAAGPRPASAYLEVSLAELDPVEVEAALFGAEDVPGVSPAPKAGGLELLEGGTLVVVRAERLEPHLQAKLANYLRFGWFHRQYGQQSVQAATRVVLLVEGDDAAAAAKLIAPLREQLGDAVLALPSLAHRGRDVLLLAEHLLARFARREGKRLAGIDREAADRLVTYAWPGNVTELEKVVERAVIVATQDSLVSSDLIFVAPSRLESHKLNLLRDDRWRAVLSDRRWLSWAGAFNLAFVGVVVWLTLRGALAPAGSALGEKSGNLGMLLTWLVWFPLLPLSAVLFGRLWCGICPIALFGELAAKLKRWNLAVPKLMRRLDFWLVAASFVVLDYVEELTGVADRPGATFALLAIILGLAALFTVTFERRAFCRHLCPLASLLGTYAGLAPIEVRGNRRVCQAQCGRFTCYKGTEDEPGCPLASYPASINTSYECMMCGHCLRSCKDRGVQVNLRPPLSELWRRPQPMLSMSLFAVVLVGLMAKHQFPDLTFWQRIAGGLGWAEGTIHTVQFLGFGIAALLSFLLAAVLSAAASQESLARNAALYGVAFVPLAFSGHLAHVAHEVLGDGLGELIAYGTGFFGGGGAATPTEWVAGPVLTFLKFLIVAGGFAGSWVAVVMIARQVSRTNVVARALPHLLLLLAFGAGYLWIFTGATAPPVAVSPTVAVVSTPVVVAPGR